jgi:hypothetical protein
MKINDVLKIDNNFHSNSSNVSRVFVMTFSWVYLFNSRTPIPKGNKVRNMHAIRFGLLYFVVHFIVMIIG